MQYNKRKITKNYNFSLFYLFIHLFNYFSLFYSNKEFYLIVSHENNVTSEKQAYWYKKYIV